MTKKQRRIKKANKREIKELCIALKKVKKELYKGL